MIKKAIKKIKEKIKKKEAWEKVDVSPMVKNGILVLKGKYTHEQFDRICKRALDQKIEFDIILTTYDCYRSLHEELLKEIPAEHKYALFSEPLTKLGHQTLEGIKHTVTGKIIKIITIKPKGLTIVN